MDIDERDRVAELWDHSQEQYRRDDRVLYWELLPAVQRYQNEMMTGDAETGYFDRTLGELEARTGNTGLRGLSIGCNEGDPACEMILFERGLFARIEVVDLAEGLLERQQGIARSRGIEGIDYLCRNLNAIEIEPDVYDFIWAVGTVHHVERLDHLFDQINKGLRSGGLFMMREYIGPRRLQFTDRQLRIVNEILRILPEPYKKTADGRIKNHLERYDIEAIKAHDPSESIRSDEIMHFAAKHLELIEVAETGGTILHPLLSDIAFNFDRDETGAGLIEGLILLERILLGEKVLPSDYVFCLAGKTMK